MSKKKSNQLYQEIQNMFVVYAEEATQWARFSQRDTEMTGHWLRFFDLYPLRFQIEWLFRIWKDQLGLMRWAIGALSVFYVNSMPTSAQTIYNWGLS